LFKRFDPVPVLRDSKNQQNSPVKENEESYNDNAAVDSNETLNKNADL
jgi:hypothetical protein